MSDKQQPQGKLAALRAQSRNQVVTSTAAGIRGLAEGELQPVTERLDALRTSLDSLPDRIEASGQGSALAIREALEPVAATVQTLRADLNSLPMAMAQQMDGVLAQVQTEGQSMRLALDRIHPVLSTLPQEVAAALSTEIVGIVRIADRLDEVLALQRNSLDALHTESLERWKAALRPVVQGLGQTNNAMMTSAQQLTAAAQRTSSMLDSFETWPDRVREAATEARKGATTIKNQTTKAVEQIETAVEQIGTATTNTVEAIQKAQGPWWQRMVEAAMVAVVVGGALTWVNWTVSKSRTQPVDVRVKAWEIARQEGEANPEVKAWMADVLNRAASQMSR